MKIVHESHNSIMAYISLLSLFFRTLTDDDAALARRDQISFAIYKLSEEEGGLDGPGLPGLNSSLLAWREPKMFLS